MKKSNQPRLRSGGLYASKGEDKLWRVLKVLAYDKSTVYLRLYTNRFKRRPVSIDPAELTLAMTVEHLKLDVIPIGVGCLPVDRASFVAEEKYYLGHAPVTEAEISESY